MIQDLAHERVMHTLLERQAAKYGERTYLYYKDEEFSFAEVNATANRVASSLQKLGIVKGDKVAVIMDNCPEVVFLVFGLSKIGAVEVPINTAHKGEVLNYMLSHSDSNLLFMHSHYINQLEPILGKIPNIRNIVILHDDSVQLTAEQKDANLNIIKEKVGAFGKQVLQWEKLIDNDGIYEPVDVTWGDPIMILYTSGTTGLSKGVLLPHNLMFSAAERIKDYMLNVTEEDRCFNYQPLFHIAGWHGSINLALISGARAVLAKTFSASRFWDEVRRYGCTCSVYIGAVTSILFKADPKPDDADNPLRMMVGAPTPKEIFEEFQQRFGVRLVEFYGSTEIAAPLMNQLDKYKVGSCGKVHPDFDVKLVDDFGVEVGPHTVGEILVRPHKPNSMMLGYYKMPEQTLEAWKDLWFHTGDYAYYDEDGYFFFADRKKDALRRRGENISSFELEKTINSHPAVQESAVIGVKSDLGEDDVMVCLALKPGQSLKYEELLAFCEERMAYFMVPRYVRFLDALPKTATLRVEKYKLREEGITADTWDREKAGYKVKR